MEVPVSAETGTGKDLGPFCVAKRAGSTEFLLKLRAAVGLGLFRAKARNRLADQRWLKFQSREWPETETSTISGLVGLDLLFVPKSRYGSARFCGNGHWKGFGPAFRSEKQVWKCPFLRKRALEGIWTCFCVAKAGMEARFARDWTP